MFLLNLICIFVKFNFKMPNLFQLLFLITFSERCIGYGLDNADLISFVN
jgi:hypothetical protein